MFTKNQIYILPFIILSLLLGIWEGWLRLGWSMFNELPLSNYMSNHGAMMAGGFIGSLICLERALGFKSKLTLLVPAISSLSILFFLLEKPVIAYALLLAGSVGLVLIYFILISKFSKIHNILMLIGALCWLIGNAILLKTYFYPSAVMWWIAFLFFTITGERLELSKYLNISTFKKYLLVFSMLIYIIGIIIPFHDLGGYIVGLSLITSAVWLFKYDMAKKSLKGERQIYYSGLVLLFGYGWLIVCGLFMIYGAYWGLLYDAALHSFFLGFVFSMIFAHAPIILPGVLKIPANMFNKSLYVWFVLLQLSLVSRVITSFAGIIDFKFYGALFNSVEILE